MQVSKALVALACVLLLSGAEMSAGGRAAGPAESQRRAGPPATRGGGRRCRGQRVRLLQDEAELLPGRRYPGVRRLPVAEWRGGDRAAALALVTGGFCTASHGTVVDRSLAVVSASVLLVRP